ncbi:MAG: response regulator [Methanoregula sp.]|jgi:CheY-like chemotaxis protein|nr:response regulator [Methanoregula sp.]MDD5187348.1 response regulator [Methanoregula sp.]
MTGKGRILLMDDEQIILDVTLEVLRFLGYDVVFARDGAAAVDLYKTATADGHPFDLVILDLTIPDGVSGQEAMERLREFDPAVRAVVSSGYSNDPVMQDYTSYGFSSRLTKPYRITEIKRILEEQIPTKPVS